MKDEHEEIEVSALYAGCDCEGETFSGLNISEVDLAGAKLIDCTFENCSLSSVNLSNAVIQANFNHCKIQGINFFTAKRTLLSLNFTGCLIRYSSFAELSLPEIRFENCVMEQVDFADAKLIGANFHGATFTECVFKNTDLSKADFRSARGYEIDPISNKLKKTRFELPEAVALLAGFDIRLD